MKLKNLMILGLVGMTMSCANHDKPNNPSDDASYPEVNPNPYFPPNLPESQTKKVRLDLASLTCADINDCPQNVGLVVTTDGQCTASLIQPDVVLTNSHCIPDEVKANPKLCSEKLGFVSLRDDHISKVESLCEKLIFASDISDKGKADYAVFQLKTKVPVAPVKVSLKGFNDEMIATVYSVNPNSEHSISGVLQRKTCKAIQNSMIADNFFHSLALQVSFFGDACEMIPGNSGSPVLVNGEQRAVMCLALRKNSLHPVLEQIRTNASIATNLACLSFGNIIDEKNSDCGQATAVNKLNAFSNENKMLNVKSGLDQLVARSPHLKYNIKYLRTDKFSLENIRQIPHKLLKMQFRLIADCAIAPNKNKQKVTAHILDRSEVSLMLSVDEFARASLFPRVSSERPQNIEIEYDFKKNIAMLRSFGYDGLSNAVPSSLRICTAADLKSPYSINDLPSQSDMP